MQLPTDLQKQSPGCVLQKRCSHRKTFPDQKILKIIMVLSGYSLSKICQNTGFLKPRYSRIRIESKIFPFSGMFYAVIIWAASYGNNFVNWNFNVLIIFLLGPYIGDLTLLVFRRILIVSIDTSLLAHCAWSNPIFSTGYK